MTIYCIVSEETVKKNLAKMGKALKRLEVDLKNAKNDQKPDPEDRFVEVMEISFARP